MNYLVDTNVLCEPRQKFPNPAIVRWLRENETSLYTSALVVGEIRYGIGRLPANSRLRQALMAWLSQLIRTMEGRILAVNTRVAEEWACIQAEAAKVGRNLPVVDSLLAATARRYQLTMITNNIEDFRFCGVKVLNPFHE